jgi:hypothetical protein
MSIEINKLIVKATITETGIDPGVEQDERSFLDAEEIKAETISACKDLFYELMDQWRDR